jgi:glycogen synthase
MQFTETKMMMRSVLKSKPRRVLMTADTVGGVWTYSLELARGLGRHGVKVFLATMGAELSREQIAEACEIDNLQVIESRFKLEWMPDAWADVNAAGDWLLGLEAEFSPDVIHLNGYSHAALPWKAPVIAAAHSCVCSWWRAVKSEKLPAAWREYCERVTSGLTAADLVIAPSRAMLASLEEHYGPIASTRVIPNGRSQSFFDRMPKEEMILAAGRLWDEAKNIWILTSIASDLPWPVYIAGETRHPGGKQAEFSKVECLGKLCSRELAAWFGKASIYALPARYEPFGLSALEAGLAECALVLGDIPSLREVWGDAAVFVSPSDPSQLKCALRELAADTARRTDMGARARARALEYSTGRMTQRYLEAYSEVMNAAGKVQSMEELAACAP